MHRNSWMMFEKHAAGLLRPGMRVLEIAPEAQPSALRTVASNPAIAWETLDLQAGPGITYVAASEYEYPIADDTFDAVVSANVIEHVRKTWTWMRELARITKPGGYVVTVNPVNWAYHANPVDCWRIFPDGARALHEDAGLTTIVAEYGTLDHTPMNQPAALPLAKQALRKLFGRKAYLPYYCEGAIDTVAVGQKPARSVG